MRTFFAPPADNLPLAARLLALVLVVAVLIAAAATVVLLLNGASAHRYRRMLLGLALFLCLSPFLVRAQMLWQASFALGTVTRSASLWGSLAGLVALAWGVVAGLSIVGGYFLAGRPRLAAAIPPGMAVFFYAQLLPNVGFGLDSRRGHVEVVGVLVFSLIPAVLAYLSAAKAGGKDMLWWIK